MMGGWEFGWFFMVTFWALFVVGLVWLVTAVGRGGDGGARRTLDERFAAGELTPEEYEQRRRALR
jgi:putative membrane protein